MVIFSVAVSSNPDFNFEQFQSRMAFHRRTGSIPGAIQHHTGYSFDPGSNPNKDQAPPHHHHQVLYVCRGHCSGPQCDFSKSLKQGYIFLKKKSNLFGNGLEDKPPVGW